MINIYETIGYVGTCILGITLAPQVYNTYVVNKSAAGISIGYLTLQLLANILFIIYAFYLNSLPIIISNGLVFTFTSLLMFAKFYFRNNEYTSIK